MRACRPRARPAEGATEAPAHLSAPLASVTLHACRPCGRRAEGEPEGHAHLGAPHPAGAASARRFQKAVLREWATLRANLPTSIWVRAYESRCARDSFGPYPPAAARELVIASP